MDQSISGVFAQMRQSRLDEETEDKVLDKKADEVLDEEEAGVESETGSEEPEMNEAMKKVVRDGKVVTKKVTTKKKRLSAAQKQALAQARKKAHTAGANKARAKSNKIGKARGLHEEDSIVCPDCGFEGTKDDFEEEDGHLYCPTCGTEICCEEKGKEKKCSKNEEVDVAELAVRLDECGGSEYMKNALNEGKYDLVQKYLSIKEGE